MNTETLLEITKTRLNAHYADDNPTGKSFFYELVKALERLKDYEEKEDTKK